MKIKSKIFIEVPVSIKKEKNYYIARASNRFIIYGRTKEKVLKHIKDSFINSSMNENVEYSFRLIND